MDDNQDQQHDLAAQQAAAKDYQPVYEGPMVGNKTDSAVIPAEYAKADRVYVEKTLALSQTYSHYRPIQGDGNCGWRAIGFAYFEKLIEAGDQALIQGEVSRILSFNSMLQNVGGYDYIEDWVDETIGLLRQVAEHMSQPTVAYALMHEKWNDASVAPSIIYHMRLLAATYLKANADRFDPFVSGEGGVQGYCAQHIELPDREIEQLGIIALTEVLLKPANFVLEIAYLDRSPGSQVNEYRFPEEANNQATAALGPIIYLLYRPDHYDILYRHSDSTLADPPRGQVSLQVNRAANFTDNSNISCTQSSMADYGSQVNWGALGMLIPGFNSSGSLPPVHDSLDQSFPPSQQSPWVTDYPSELSRPETQPMRLFSLPQTCASSTRPTSLTGDSATLSTGHTTNAAGSPETPGTGYHFRFSSQHHDYHNSNIPEQSFHVTTNTFKNSVWNRAHYGNPDFHPEEWNPEDEGNSGTDGHKAGSAAAAGVVTAAAGGGGGGGGKKKAGKRDG